MSKLTPSTGESGPCVIVAGFGPGTEGSGATATKGPRAPILGPAVGATIVAESERWTNNGARLASRRVKPTRNAIEPAASAIFAHRRRRSRTARLERFRLAVGSPYAT